MKVLVVTNIRLYREGVAEALRRFPDVEEVVTAATGAAAVVTARRVDCDVVVVDMSLADSADTVRALVIARPGAERCGARVLDDDPGVAAYAEVGACGCFTGGHGR